MTELHFIVGRAPEGGDIARAVGANIFTEADDLLTLREQAQRRVLPIRARAGSRARPVVRFSRY